MDIKLVMFKPNGQRKDIPLTGSKVVIGRGEDCELRVPLLAVSRRHCELTIDGETLTAVDLASSNGTYVNDDRVEEDGMELDAGDRLRVGPVVFTVQIDGVPVEIAPTPTPVDAETADADIDEIVDLAADGDEVEAETDEDQIIANLEATDDDDEEMDPIAALEALAAESEKKGKDE